MNLIDTHTHLFLEEFNNDRVDVVNAAIKAGVKKMYLPNINSKTIASMNDLVQQFPDHCFPMIGLHPSNVNENFNEELRIVEEEVGSKTYKAIGEIGMDLYWDKTYRQQQEEAFVYQCALAFKNKLPVAIHSRECIDIILNILEGLGNERPGGIMHCFSGSIEQANRATDLGMLLGIGGVVTFKNSGLDSVVKEIDMEHIVLETDAPYLAPAPHRGKRNESSFLSLVAEKIALVKGITMEEVASVTTANANNLFGP